ncbi:MAG TPA: hypothetical protein VE969_03990 [Pyrinomonadaceae bacterium]|jgi:hypothetical protein|nr:hypothetical protein [Pyrinomonadaceae bacterium]
MNWVSTELADLLKSESGRCLPDVLLCGGVLVSATLLTIYCLAGGTLPLVTAVCVLIIGSVLGIVINRYQPYAISSAINGSVPTYAIEY